MAGSFTIGAARRKTSCRIISSMVLSIIASVFVWSQIGLSATGIGTRERYDDIRRQIDSGARDYGWRTIADDESARMQVCYRVIFSSACVYTAELLPWRRRSSSVRPSVRPSVNLGFSETAAWIQTKFYGKLPIHHISSILFFFFKIFKFLRFLFRFR